MDIIDDILRRLHDQFGALAPDARSKVERVVHSTLGEVRRDWAGDRPYIAGQFLSKQSRDASMLADYRAGHSVAEIGQRYAVNARTVRRALRHARRRAGMDGQSLS